MVYGVYFLLPCGGEGVYLLSLGFENVLTLYTNYTHRPNWLHFLIQSLRPAVRECKFSGNMYSLQAETENKFGFGARIPNPAAPTGNKEEN